MKKWILFTMIAAMLVSLGCAVDKNQNTQEDAAEDNTDEKIIFVDDFVTRDIYGEPITKDLFAEYDLTLVNLFATWCGPCISEMPELAQLQKDMRDKGVNVVAVVLDAGVVNEVEDSVVEIAKKLAEVSGAEFPFIIPDTTYLNGYLNDVTSIPESLLVDSEGRILGRSYVGARDYEAWMEIVASALSSIQEVGE